MTVRVGRHDSETGDARRYPGLVPIHMAVDQLDYDTWKTNFDNPGTRSGSITSVPEPSSSLMLVSIALVGFLLRFSRVN